MNLASYFNDPDGDALTYTAATSNASVAGVSASGSTVTVVAVAVGSATLTVTARDPGGLTATQSASVTVEPANRAPSAVDSVPAQTMTAGESVVVNLASFFNDPDNDALRYTATSDHTDVATTSVSGSDVTVAGEASGTATITVTATDPAGLSATQTFGVTVTGGGGGGTSRTYQTGENIATLPTGVWFPDQLGGGVSFQISSGQALIRFQQNGYIVEGDIRYTCISTGGCRIEGRTVTQGSVRATTSDGGGGGGTNRAPSAVDSVPAQTMTAGESVVVNLASFFTDPDNDALRYTATSDNTDVATTSVSGSDVTVAGEASGTATITVTATDPAGLSATQTFGVTVTGGGGSQAITGEITLCTANQLFPGSDSFSVTIEGMLTAHRDVTFVQVEGSANFTRVGFDSLGSMSTGESKSFSIFGVVSLTGTSVVCSVHVEYQTVSSQAQHRDGKGANFFHSLDLSQAGAAAP